jgi:hypothetical protein
MLKRLAQYQKIPGCPVRSLLGAHGFNYLGMRSAGAEQDPGIRPALLVRRDSTYYAGDHEVNE